ARRHDDLPPGTDRRTARALARLGPAHDPPVDRPLARAYPVAPVKTTKNPYDPRAIDAKWQARWKAGTTFRPTNPGDPDHDPARQKFYVLDMFPYPSGSGLHVGHAVGYIGTDIVARRKRMEGYNVLHPMGWDAFGLPAEQYAIQTGKHPRETTAANTSNYRRQLDLLGLSYDWSR